MRTIHHEDLSNVLGGAAPGAIAKLAQAVQKCAPVRTGKNLAAWVIQHTKVPPGFHIE